MNIQFDNNNSISFVDIVPIRATFIDTSDCTRLYVSIRDNLSCEAHASWHLGCEDSTFHASGWCIIDDGPYTEWSGDNQFPFIFVANSIGLTIIDI